MKWEKQEKAMLSTHPARTRLGNKAVFINRMRYRIFSRYVQCKYIARDLLLHYINRPIYNI